MHKLLKYIFQIKGFDISEAMRELMLVKNINPSDINKRNYDKKWAIFNYHKLNNPIYSKHLSGREICNWEDIPIITKKDFQTPLSERLSKGIQLKNLHIHNTSGSSGTPFFFAKDKDCHAMTWAIINDRFSWHGINIGSDLQARFYGIPLGGYKYFKERFKDYLSGRVRFPVFDLSDRKLSEYLNKFGRFPFTYINGYTSSLVLFARYIIDQGLVLNEICPTLKVVFTTSEVCDEVDRALMEKGFGVKVVNEYGAAELDLIAFQDSDGDWLVNYESLLVEVLDQDGNPVIPGEEGRVVVTSLYNKAMPFIRYELGDLAVLSDRQKGAYKILERVNGRVNDIAILPSGKKSPGLTFYYISKSLLEQGGVIKEFIIRQTAVDLFVFEYVAERPLNSEEKCRVQKAMDMYLEPGLKAVFEHKETINRTKAGKLKHFHSDLGTSLKSGV
jgi:phenylacetate-CoA ligase